MSPVPLLRWQGYRHRFGTGTEQARGGLHQSFYCCDRKQDESEFSLQHRVTTITKEVRAGPHSRNLQAETEAAAMENATSWFAHHGLLRLLSYTPQAHLPRVAPQWAGLSCIYHISRFAYRQFNGSGFFQLKVFLPDDLNLF